MGPSFNFCQHFECPWELPKTFRAATGPTVNFSQPFLQPLELNSTFRASVGPSVHFPCIRRIFCQLLLTFRACKGPSVNFPCVSRIFRQLPSTFRTATGLSANMRQLSVRPQDLPSPSFNNLCIHGTFKIVPCTHWTFRQFQATFRAVAGPSGNSQCGRGIFPPVASTFRAAVVPSVTFQAATGLQLTSINFPCIHETFRQHLSTLSAAVGPFVNFRQISVRLQDFCLLLSNCPASGFRQISVLLCFHAFCQLMSTLRVS